MRRAAVGALTLVVSIAIPATFHGTVFLVVLWLLVGLAGLILLITADPVKPRWIGWLRRELKIPDVPSSNRGPGEADVAITRIAEELEAVQSILAGDRITAYFVNNSLPTDQWTRYGEDLIRSRSLHQSLRHAYRAIVELNQMGVRRDVVVGGEPTALVDGDLAARARMATQEALHRLSGSLT